ncbi:MAG: universal stress protein [Cryobacterium sp.]
MIDHTIVGWDGSAQADLAVEWATQHVTGRTDSLRIVRTVDDTALYSDETEARWAVDVATFAVAELAARVRLAHPQLAVTTVVTRGEPGDVLAEMSEPNSLLVVGSEDGHPSDDWYSARLGVRLAAAARGAVAIIPMGDGLDRHGVLVGVDESDAALSQCFFAAELASRYNESLHAVRACSKYLTPASSTVEGPDTADRAALDAFLAPVAQAFPAVHIVAHVEYRSPVTALLDRAGRAAFVVVGARRPGTVRRLLLGSVSRALVTNARCPVVVVTPQTEPGS